MHQSSFREADSSLIIQMSSCNLWNPKFHYRVHKNQSRVHIVSRMNLIRNHQSYSFNIHFNIIQPSNVKTFRVIPLIQVFLHCESITPLYHVHQMPQPSHSHLSL